MSFTILWFFLFVLIIILFVKVKNLKQNLMSKIEWLEQTIQDLRKQFSDLEQKSRITPEEKPEEKPGPEPVKEEPSAVETTDEPVTIKEDKPEPETPADVIKPPPIPLRSAQKSVPSFEPVKEIIDDEPEVRPEPELLKKWKEFKDNVDWEQFTGTKLFAWLGGLALFIGAGFFVKYSIDKNLIPPTVRLVIGAITGLGLIIASIRFERGRYDIMRHTLAAGGIGVLYTVIFAATLYYHYLPEIIGFGCLAVVSISAFVLALYHQGIAISVLGAIGAYATPILVDASQGNLIMLFIYLAIVNIGLYKVMQRLKAPGLLLVATVGTLTSILFGTFFGKPTPPTGTIAGVWIANMMLFSLFIDKIKVALDQSKSMLWSGIILYLSVLGIALAIMIDLAGCSPMLLLTSGVAGAVWLARNNKSWNNLVAPYSVLTFIAAIIWTMNRFKPDSPSWYFLLFLVYGVVAGLGPIVLIKKYGLSKSLLGWFKTFPTAIAGLSLIVLFKDPQISFWFWPMTICLQILGIIVSLLFGSVLQVGILSLILIAGGLRWLNNLPTDFISFGFYGFILISCAILCITILFVIGKLPLWITSLKLDQDGKASKQPSPALTEWMTASPVAGAFILLAAAFIMQRPLNPHPGMATLVCFLVLALSLCKRFSFQAIGMVALPAAVFAQAVWMLRSVNSMDLYFSTVAWAGALFACALIIPFVSYRSHEKWKKVWMAWAFFELFQGIFVIWGADHLWKRELSGWLPLVLAVFKLPVTAILIKQLENKTARNSILACHGGVLLFYMSAVPIMLLEQGWIGVTFVFEACALLWLNRRVEHPGLRWVSAIMTPIGLFLLLTFLPQMKTGESIIILNAAVLSVAACIVAMSLAVNWASFPNRMLGKIDLPVYFLWFAVGTGFYLVNLLVADIFAGSQIGSGVTLKFAPRGDLLQSICNSLLWAGFGAVLWRIGAIPKKMRIAGIIILCLGTGWLLTFPILHPRAIAQMRPFFNFGLIAYLPLMAILFYLFLKEPLGDKPESIKNLFLALFLIAGFLCIKVEKSTILQQGQTFALLQSHTISMGVGSAVGWLLYGLGMWLWPWRLDKPFRHAGLVLILLGFFKAAILPFRFRGAFGAMSPLLNMPTLLFLFCLVTLVFLIRRGDDENWPIKTISAQPFWGILFGILAFYVLNIEIASAFGIKGRSFSLMTHGSLSHQLGYSLGWLVFSIGMLVTGIKWDFVKVRWASLILLVITALKIFFKDLWSLGQLYRVASFIGLAVVLILVSFLYQRYLSDGSQNVAKN